MTIEKSKQIVGVIVGGLIVASCNCAAPLKVTPIQRGDKKLTCKEVIVEINEAEHYRTQAEGARRISGSEMLAPSCWITGYTDSNAAVKLANDRINYLGNIYDLLDCGGSARSQVPPRQGQPSGVVVRPQGASGAPPGVVRAPVPQQKLIPRQGLYPPGGELGAPSYNPNAPQRRRPAGSFVPPEPLTEGGANTYRRIPIDKAGGDTWLHEHSDHRGKIYQHSHPHRGPHRHAEDIPGEVKEVD